MKHLTSINDLNDDDIAYILTLSARYGTMLDKGRKIPQRLKNKIIVTMFLENSTRTRTSFEMAALRLGGNIVNWDSETSSLKKGETFGDTIDTLGAMKPDAIIIRSPDYNAPYYVAQRVKCPVINAGDSWREHPTQALLDAFTIIEAKKSIRGLTITICGDVGHSRVAHSNMILLSRLGAKLRVIAPSNLMPQKLPVPVESFTSMEDGLPGSDIIMMLRTQKERMDIGDIPNDAVFHRRYGLTADRLALAPKALVMHPGPMNRGIEIADEVADDPARSLILRQVKNGVIVRMAVLDFLLNQA